MGREDVWRIRDDRSLSWSAKLVWLILESRGDDCRPSVSVIAADCGISKPTVRKARAELVSGGWLKESSAVSAAGDSDSNSYLVTTPRWGGKRACPPPGEEEPSSRGGGQPQDPPGWSTTDTTVVNHRHGGGQPQTPKEEKGSVKGKCKKNSDDQLPLIGPAEPADSPGFDAFWAVYPRKVGKIGAKSCWDRARKKADPRAIIAGAQRYRDDPNREDEFTKHPSTWLNKGCWDDEPLPQRSRAGRQPDRLEKNDDALASYLAKQEATTTERRAIEK